MKSTEVSDKVRELVGFEKRLYELLPDECWMTEQTMCDKLSDRYRKVGRTKLRNAKFSLVNKEILLLDELRNGNRKNPRHKLWKALPVIRYEEGLDEYRYELEDDFEIDDNYEGNEDEMVDWELIQKYTAEDINNMDKLEQVDLYLEAGLIVLPTAYPIFTPDGVICSCYRREKCASFIL